MKTWAGIVGCLLSLMAAPAIAHHTTAEFDYTKVYRVTGVTRPMPWWVRSWLNSAS